MALMDLCADILLTELTQILFGQLVCEIQPELTQQLYDFNEANWKVLVFESPNFTARRAANAKDSILDAIEITSRRPKNYRKMLPRSFDRIEWS